MAQVGGTLRRVAGRVAKVSLIVVLNTLALFVIANIVADYYLNRDQPAVSDEQRRRMMAGTLARDTPCAKSGPVGGEPVSVMAGLLRCGLSG